MKLVRVIKPYFIVILLQFYYSFTCYSSVNDGSKYTSHSKLSSGKWVKLKVTDNAIYKLSYEEIRSMGFDDPSKVKLYGYGGWLQSETLQDTYIDDLPEVKVWLSGDDNKLDAGEFLLFYGRGPVKWSYNRNGSNSSFIHENNPYSTYGCYFLGESTEGMSVMPVKPSVTSVDKTYTTFEDYFVHEKEEYSVTKAGRGLVGESFGSRSRQSFSFSIPGILDSEGSVHFSFVATVKTNASAALFIDGNTLYDKTILAINEDYQKSRHVNEFLRWTGSKQSQTEVVVNYSGSGQSAYLDFIRLNVQRELRYYSAGYTFFRNSTHINSTARYDISGANSNLLVFDVTDNYNSERINTTLSNGTLSFGLSAGNAIPEMVLVDPTRSDFPGPEVVGEVLNQDLHASGQVDMVIISASPYLAASERLAEKHRSYSGLSVLVVEEELIFNEFSSGVPDVTAYRRFMKMFYDRSTGTQDSPKYLLLMGDGMYDNRFVDPDLSNYKRSNFLLTYAPDELVTSHGDLHYCSDDYFCFLDENDDSESLVNKKMQVAVGRLPVQSLSQAQSVVSKIIGYMDNTRLGSWKNRVVFLADDADNTTISSPNSSFTGHMNDAEAVAAILEKDHPEIMVTKVYLDAYAPDVSTGTPSFDNTAKKQLFNTLQEGCMMLNYSGHGSATKFAHEIIHSRDIQQMNFPCLPLWFTATCDFAPFESTLQSAAEAVILNEKSAGIAIISTTRVVYQTYNNILNRYFTELLFTKTGGKYPTVGEALKDAKNRIRSDYKNNKLKYVLLGDPALRLSFPEHEIKLSTINGEDYDANSTYTFKAMETVSIGGYIYDYQGRIDKDFTGKLTTTVFDGIQRIQTITKSSLDTYAYFNDYPYLIYTGTSEVEAGEFRINFTVPLDITYSDLPGKMNFYATLPDGSKEAGGFIMNYNLNGTDDGFDTNGLQRPVITGMYLNSEKFVPGGKVNETPYFFAYVEDEYGFNVSGSSLGHDVELIIDDLPSTTYILNNYFHVLDDEGKKGMIRFSIPELEEGTHSLKLRVWNIVNLSVTDTIEFIVRQGLKPDLFEMYAAYEPGDVRSGINFVLLYDRPESIMEVTVTVYDITGRPVWGNTSNGSTGMDNAYEVFWNLHSQRGGEVPKGVYIYKAAIKTVNGTQTTKAQKIIVKGK